MLKYNFTSLVRFVITDVVFSKNLRIVAILFIPMWILIIIGISVFYQYSLNKQVDQSAYMEAMNKKIEYDTNVLECEKILSYVSNTLEVKQLFSLDNINFNKYRDHEVIKNIQQMVLIANFTNKNVEKIYVFDEKQNILINRDYAGRILDFDDNKLIQNISEHMKGTNFATYFSGNTVSYAKRISQYDKKSLIIIVNLNLVDVFNSINPDKNISNFKIYSGSELKFEYAGNQNEIINIPISTSNEQFASQNIKIKGVTNVLSRVASSYNDWHYVWTKPKSIYNNTKQEKNILFIVIILFVTIFGILLTILVNIIIANKLRKLQAFSLQSQINPHFLYNTLEMISLRSNVLLKGDNEISDIVSKLSGMIRNSMSINETLNTFSDEILHAKRYIDIMQLRYRDKFTVEWNIDESLKKCSIPKITLQPLIENAIYHGIKPMKGKGKIKISAIKAGSDLIIKIEDNGVGIYIEKQIELRAVLSLSGKSINERIGLSNINERLKLIFGKKYGLNLESEEGKGTICTITIPFGFNTI
jgi:two-component system sensor histidine kinase YesM